MDKKDKKAHSKSFLLFPLVALYIQCNLPYCHYSSVVAPDQTTEQNKPFASFNRIKSVFIRCLIKMGREYKFTPN